MMFDDRVLELVGAALRIEEYAKRLVVLSEKLYDEAITVALSVSDQAGGVRFRAREELVLASEEENNDDS